MNKHLLNVVSCKPPQGNPSLELFLNLIEKKLLTVTKMRFYFLLQF